MTARADDREDLVAPRPRDQPTAHDERDQHPGHQGEQLEARAGRRGAVDDLEVQRQEDDRPEHREADDEGRRPWRRRTSGS